VVGNADDGPFGDHPLSDRHGEAETFHDAVDGLVPRLPISGERLRRNSRLVAGLQTNLGQFGD
jgi:hypothetical protein